MTNVGEHRHHLAVELERNLGDPRNPSGPCGYAAMVERDRAAVLPKALLSQCGEILRVGVLPREAGGLDIDQLIGVLRVCARRDLTVIPAALFSLTALMCVELAGDDKQRERVRRAVAEGENIGFALSEPDHGSDLLNNATILTRDDKKWYLKGTKWLVGMGEEEATLLVIARTGDRGPGSFTTVLTRASPKEIDSASGFRGIPLGRYEFRGHRVYDRDVVGHQGQGLETAMKAMSVVRVVSTAANLAAMDTALRLAYGFTHRHRVGGTPIDRTPQVRRELGTAVAASNAADVVAMVCARSLHKTPKTAALFGGIAKVVVPALADVVMDRVSDLLGSRSIMTTSSLAAFDVMRRDNGVVRYIDTSPTAAIRQLIPQLRQIRAAATTNHPTSDFDIVVDLSAPVTPFALSDTELTCRGRDDVWALANAIWQVNDLDVHGGRGTMVARLRPLFERAAALRATALASIEGPDSFSAAESFCFAHSALTCLVVAVRAGDDGLFADPSGQWISSTVDLLLDRADSRRALLPADGAEQCFRLGERLWRKGLTFSALPVLLAESSSENVPKERP
ncbi:MAG: acyl-CoA dehydrogenase family protein [Brevibacterium linens]|uniref:acyl-CoA dehydrogenase family protein n=1 Tax=Brevibacterium linens TaxID=1703 RepID=UPI003F9A164A